jgi:hypothetical protein
MGTLVIKNIHEVIELGLLLKEVPAAILEKDPTRRTGQLCFVFEI